MDIWDHQGNVETIYLIAGADPSNPLPARRLALLIPEILAVQTIRNLNKDGRLICIGVNEYEIHIKASLKHKRFEFACNHEIAEWFMFAELDPDKERACNELAKELCVPNQLLLQFSVGSPPDIAFIAPRLKISEQDAAVKIAEWKRLPLAIVTLNAVGFAGAAFNWPEPQALINMVRSNSVKGCFVQQASDVKNVWFVWGRE